jgi:hypothetical protein
MQLRIQQENNGLKLFLFINRGIRVVLMVVSVKDCNQRGGHHLRIELFLNDAFFLKLLDQFDKKLSPLLIQKGYFSLNLGYL